jgi:hypothetical protein
MTISRGGELDKTVGAFQHCRAAAVTTFAPLGNLGGGAELPASGPFKELMTLDDISNGRMTVDGGATGSMRLR